ncbi:MAG TPA: CAAD domain-containing protein [Leptolyngbyaceae cyanobacterium M33_DOE_097]|uniref:Cyanobacterial aminoacyl-tRNA synthetase CAAD domain-containing protein n=1 Tax=Oscillatoriales cyanobacterium SpSt-418 TaxID=2282169 RepID=A0A7C3PGQ9_9CYAN|nr:CAAD domain-containing protein [Leptolyngbyaceae cyanobacterium M33_DOE_097]
MDPELKETEFTTAPPKVTVEVDPTVNDSKPAFETTVEDSTLNLPSGDETQEQLRQIWERVYNFLAGLPEYLSEFFGAYRRPLITLGLIFGSIVSVKLTLALLDAINDIPLLEPTFELIGLAYTAWFVYRYLRRAENRRELLDIIDNFKADVLGRNNPRP